MLKSVARAPRTLLTASLIIALLGLGLAGCSDDETPIVVPECEDPDVLRFPPTADQLMANFRAAYEAMDPEAYLALLDPGFEMLLLPETREEFPHLGATLDYADEQIIAERMFSGEAITNSKGEFVPGVSAINFLRFEQQEVWSTAGPETGFPGAQKALFDVEIMWDRPGYSTLRVTGSVRMFAATHDTVVCGTDVTYHRLAGMQDLTGGWAKSGIERTAFGVVKAVFW